MMKMVLIFVCLLLSCFALSSEHNLTIDEDFEIEKQLKLLNKPAIKTIVENEDIFDCVDINKQPAFDHPSLKDHQIQLRPSSLPVGLFDNDMIKSSSRINSMEVGLQKSCPSGTVPIKRVTKEQLIGMRSSFKQYKIRPSSSSSSSSSSSNANDNASTQRWATIHTPLKPNHQFWYYGASGLVGIYGFPGMQDTQFSLGGFWIANDDDLSHVNHIVVGWVVDPKNNGDKNSRLMAGWTNDNFKSTGCVNYACPGFVQVSKDTPLGNAISPVSTYNGTQRGIELFVFRDPTTLNWWFFCGPDKKLVGYWPNNLFTTLAQYGTRLEFGGTAGYTGNAVFPPMGSGHFPDEGYSKSCLYQMVKYIDGDSRSDDLPLLEGYPYSDSPCYKAGDFTESGNKNNYFYFGGPGGIDC